MKQIDCALNESSLGQSSIIIHNHSLIIFFQLDLCLCFEKSGKCEKI